MPTSPNYSKHWSIEQVRAFFAPDDDSVRAVKEWLVSSGIATNEKSIRVSHSGTWLQLNTTVGKVQKATQAQYSVYSNAHREAKFLGTESYSLPESIAPHVDFIVPGVSFVQLEGASPKRSPRKVSVRQDSKAGDATGECTADTQSLYCSTY